MSNETEQLRQKLTHARREATLGLLGMMFGTLAAGFGTQWFFQANHLLVNAQTLPLVAFGSVMMGSLLAALMIVAYRTGLYRAWNRQAADRFADAIMSNPHNQKQSQS